MNRSKVEDANEKAINALILADVKAEYHRKKQQEEYQNEQVHFIAAISKSYRLGTAMLTIPDLIEAVSTTIAEARSEADLVRAKPLQKCKLDSLDFLQEYEGSFSCSICQEDHRMPVPMCILRCNHRFCKDGIRTWLSTYNHICPVCRCDV